MKTHRPHERHLWDIAAATQIEEPTTMMLDAFLQRFDGQLATGGKEMNGQMYETHIEQTVAVQLANPECVWTLFDDGVTVSKGYHYVNRLGYFIVSGPYQANADIYYRHDFPWVKLFAHTKAGEHVWNEIAKQAPSGVIAYMHLDSVLATIRMYGYTAAEGMPPSTCTLTDDELLAELARV